MADHDAERPLPLKQRIGYGVGDVGGNMFFTIISFWLLDFFVDELGLTAAAAGTAILIGRVWDAVSRRSSFFSRAGIGFRGQFCFEGGNSWGRWAGLGVGRGNGAFPGAWL